MIKYESSMAKHLVLVAGNIGVGKTTLTERIGARLGWWTGYESVADNPYLSDFYSDMRAWSFHLQVFFLGHRAEQYLEASRDARSAILDRSIYEDTFIFARALHHMISQRRQDVAGTRVAAHGTDRPPSRPRHPTARALLTLYDEQRIVLGEVLAVPCNPQSALAGLNSLSRGSSPRSAPRLWR